MELPESSASVINWIFRLAIVKFIVISAMVAVVSLLVPIAMEYLAPWLNVSSLNSAFGNVPGSVWYFLDFFAVPYGVKLLISAYVSKFMIKRLPFIG